MPEFHWMQNLIVFLCSFDVDDDAESLTIKATKSLQAGQEYSVNIKFTGILNDRMRGFYRTK